MDNQSLIKDLKDELNAHDRFDPGTDGLSVLQAQYRAKLIMRALLALLEKSEHDPQRLNSI